MMNKKSSEGGFRIPLMGGNRNLIKSAVANELVQALNSLGNMSIVEADGLKRPRVIYSDGNVVLQIRKTDTPVEGSITAARVQQYRLKSVQGDYLTCRTWDGSTEGGTDVFIAKNYKLRNSITSQVIDGVTVDYTYTTTVERVAEIATAEETQVVVPRYLANDLIYAIASNATGVEDAEENPITLIDINADGRAWAKKAGT
jgi:hypothetical protein